MPACIEVCEINREYFVSIYGELLCSHLQQHIFLTGVVKRFLIPSNSRVGDKKPFEIKRITVSMKPPCQ